MKTRVRLIYSIIILLFFLCTFKTLSAKASFDSDEEILDLIDGVISYNEKNSGVSTQVEWISNILPNEIGATAEWYVLGLSQFGNYDFNEYSKALNLYLSENDIKGASARLKFSLLLAFTGGDTSYINKCMNDDTVGGQGIMSYVFGLHLMNNGFNGRVSKEEIIRYFKENRKPDGGWSLMGEYGDVDVTAMTLTALAPCAKEDYFNDINKGESDKEALKKDVLEMIDGAVAFLSEKQLDNGDYQSFGVRNAESTAQVITALSAVGIDCVRDSRFVKNGRSPLDGISIYRLEDGSFSHKEGEESNPSATVQTFYSFVAYLRMRNNLSSLYVRETDETKVVTRYERYTDNNLPELNKESTNKTELKDEVNDKPISDDKTGKEESEPDRVPDKQNDEVKTDVNNKTTYNKKAGGYKIYAILVLAGVCLAVSLILILLKKNRKNHLFVGIVGICGILLVLFTDFSSPEDYYGQAIHKENIIGKVTMSIRCDILANEEKKEHIPDDYCILEETVFEISEGETAYDILLQGARQFGISVEHEGGSDLVYVSGINYLYEHDYGDLSGWVYKVNGSLPSVGCAGYKLKDKDTIEWCYTLNLGNDVLGE